MIEFKWDGTQILINARYIQFVDYDNQTLTIYLDGLCLEYTNETLEEITTSELYQQIKLRLIRINK